MIRPTSLLLLLLAIAGFIGCQSAPSTSRGHDPARRSGAVQRIRLVLDRQEQAVQSGNLAAFDSLWSGAAGVLVFEQGSVDTTWAAYRDHHLGPELEALQELCYRHEGTEVRVGNTMAVATGRYHLTARYEGRPVESKGLFTTVFERQGDDWMIVHTHLSRRSENR